MPTNDLLFAINHELSDEAIALRARAIVECLEILDLRIRFNNAILDFAQQASLEDYKSYLRHKNPTLLDYEIAHIRHQEVLGTKNDLEVLHALKAEIDKLQKDPDNAKNKLFVVSHLHKIILIEDRQREKVLDNYKRLKRHWLEKVVRAHRRGDLRAKQEAQSSLDAVNAGIERYKSLQASSYTEYQYYIRIRELLNQSVFFDLEKDFISKYTIITIKSVDDVFHATISFSPAIIELRNRNLERFNAVQCKIERYTRESAVLPPSPLKDVKIYEKQDDLFFLAELQGPKEDLQTMYNFLDTYINLYNLDKITQAVDSLYENLANLEQRWLQDQERILVAEQAENARREAEIEAAAAQKKEDERKRLEEIHQSELLRQRAERERRKAEYTLEKQRREQEREAEKVKKEVDKRRRHMVFVKEANTINSAPDGKRIDSKFKVDMQTVKDNVDFLLLLFDAETKKIRYSNIESNIRPFGGKLVKDTASSHQYIVFNEKQYQEVVFVDSEDLAHSKGDVVGGVARPGEPWLMHHNLYLLRAAVESVLPEGWLQYLKANKKTSLKLRN